MHRSLRFFLMASTVVSLGRSQGVDPKCGPACSFVEAIVADTNGSCVRLERARLELLRSMHSDMLPDRYLRNVVGDRRWLWQSTLREAAAGVASVLSQFTEEAGCSPSFKGEALSHVQELSESMLVAAVAAHEHHRTYNT